MEEKSLLIIHQGAFGDLMLTFPAIQALKKNYSRIDGICQSQLGKLACHLDIFHKYIPLESASISSLYSDIIDKKIREIIYSYNDIALFSFSRQLEHSVNRLREKPVFRISPRPQVQSKNIHTADYLVSALIKCGLIRPEDSSILEYADNHENRFKFYSDSKILIHPGSGSLRKNWSIENFLKLYDTLESLFLNPEFILGPAEDFLAEEIKKDSYPRVIHRPSDLIGLHSILETGSLYIGNDSGVSHLAAFSGLASVIIFGPSDPERWSPKGKSVHVVRPELLNCLPCFETQKNNCQNPLCLDNTTIEQVLTIVKNLICNV